MSTEDDIKHLHRGTLVLDCPAMRLERPSADNPLKLEAPGTIYQDKSGRLKFKLLTSVRPQDFHSPLRVHAPRGSRVPESALFALAATDYHGREWHASDIFIGRGGFTIGQPMMVESDLFSIAYSRKIPWQSTNSGIKLICFDDFTFPANQLTEMKLETGGQLLRGRKSVEGARFQLGGQDVRVHDDDGIVTVVASLKAGENPHSFEKRFTQTVHFVFARPFRRLAKIVWDTEKEYVELTSHPAGQLPAHVRPPLTVNSLADPAAVYTIMDCFYRHIEQVTTEFWHPIYYPVLAAMLAGESTLESQALVLGVAIEGILNEGFPDIGAALEEFQEAVRVSITCIQSLELGSDHKQRITSALGGMLSASARGKLEHLARQGKIRHEHVFIWKDMRNRLAHGNFTPEKSTDEMYRIINATTTLLHCLVFAAIGYEGPFTDYSAVGWPEAQYPDAMRDSGEAILEAHVGTGVPKTQNHV